MIVPRSRLPAIGLTLLVISFFLCGLAMIPYAGVQTDEAIFTSVLFEGSYPLFWISVFKKKIPLMVMTYIGTTKAALYGAIFSFWKPSVYSLRVPATLLGAASIPLFYLFLKRALGVRPALFATVLLSFDTCYLMASVFDWGPVAIQHACFLAGCLLLLKHAQISSDAGISSTPSLAGGFFFLGLGLWDKAIFLWMLSGASIATVAVFPYIVKRNLTPEKITKAAIFFSLGCLPLLIYNVRRPLATFRGNTVFSTQALELKVQVLAATANGSVFSGYVVGEDGTVDPPRQPRTAFESAAVTFADITGRRRESFYWRAFLASLALTPFLLFTQWRRPLAFAVITMSIAFAQMLFNQNTGGGAHHSILLWPLPLMVIAIAVESIAERLGRWGNAFTASLAGLLAVSAFLVTVDYQRRLIHNGAPGAWTDAIFELARRLEALHPTAILLTDWGLLDNTRMLQQGRIPLRWSSEALTNPTPTELDLKALRMAMEEPGAVFIGNTDSRQNFLDVNPRLRQLSAQLGFERELLDTVPDTLGRPCFEIFRFHPKPAPPPLVGVTKDAARRNGASTGGVGRVVQEQPAVK